MHTCYNGRVKRFRTGGCHDVSKLIFASDKKRARAVRNGFLGSWFPVLGDEKENTLNHIQVQDMPSKWWKESTNYITILILYIYILRYYSQSSICISIVVFSRAITRPKYTKTIENCSRQNGSQKLGKSCQLYDFAGVVCIFVFGHKNGRSSI